MAAVSLSLLENFYVQNSQDLGFRTWIDRSVRFVIRHSICLIQTPKTGFKCRLQGYFLLHKSATNHCGRRCHQWPRFALRGRGKEYISVIEGTAPTIVLQRFDSPNLSPDCFVRRAGSAVYCRQSGKRLGESHLCKTMAGAVTSITNIYSLSCMLRFRFRFRSSSIFKTILFRPAPQHWWQQVIFKNYFLIIDDQ